MARLVVFPAVRSAAGGFPHPAAPITAVAPAEGGSSPAASNGKLQTMALLTKLATIGLI
jgi:hypothetical protein